MRRHDTVHLVDEHGLVRCPRRDADVDVGQCLHCEELLVAVRHAGGSLREIRCTPPARSVSPSWVLLGPDLVARR